MEPSCKYLSAVFPAAVPTLADLHNGQRRLFCGRMWICISVCEYLVIWCGQTTVYEIIDYSSMFIILRKGHIVRNELELLWCSMHNAICN
jgi:hypothetical protein